MPTCALCKNDRELRESHIVPKFVFRWMAKTSGTKYFRQAVTPNLRRQDGPKQKLLCSDCEALFSTYERWFAEHIFRPYIENRQFKLPYDENLFRFIISLLWRVLYLDLPNNYTSLRAHRGRLVEAEAEWRAFLTSGALPSRFRRAHLFLTDIGTSDGVQPVVNLNVYLARDVDSTVAAGRRDCIVYSKFARFIFWGEITDLESEATDGTLVAPQGGTLSVPQTVSNGRLGQFLVDRARTVHEMAQQISDEQRGVIEQSLRENAHVVRGSDLAAAMEADFAATIQPVHGRVGRNERCPCGSGVKFKKCHGR